MRRREFIAGLGGAAVWPEAARAQQGEWMRRIGVLNSGDENDPAAKSYVAAFTRALADLGWSDGRNVRMDVQWGGVVCHMVGDKRTIHRDDTIHRDGA
jgi:putative tryptophan/tyrosine transport system substrate-binding protein